MDANTITAEAPALYVGTYRKYNNGSIAGDWLKLDDYADAAAFITACKELHKDEADPELMFQDFDCLPAELYSESGMDFEKIYQWLALDESDREIVAEYLEATGYTFDDTDMDDAREAYVTTIDQSWNHAKALGEYFAEAGCIEIPEGMERYFDYEAYGQDELYSHAISSNNFVFYTG